jgi:hypothetical protein
LGDRTINCRKEVKYAIYQCKEVIGLHSPVGEEELVLRSGDIGELHLLHPRMEELYCAGHPRQI